MFDKRTTYAADYGKRKYTAVTPDGDALTLEPAEFIKLEWIADGSTLIVEDAHVKYFRTYEIRSSLAQPLDEGQQATLIENARARNIDIRIFSCGYTRKVFAGNDPFYAVVDAKSKDDETDARLILEYFTTVSRQIMTRPLRPYSRDLDALALKKNTDQILNTMRTSWGVDGGATLNPSVLEYSEGDFDHVAKELLEMGVVARKPKRKDILDQQPNLDVGKWLLDRYGSTVSGDRREKAVDIVDQASFKFLYTLMCCVIDPSTGKRTSQLNHREIQSVLLTPSDKRLGGIARSNVYYHYLRPSHIKKAMERRGCPCGSKPLNYFKDGEPKKKLEESNEARLPCEECQRIRSEYLAAARVAVRAILRLFIEWVESDDEGRDAIMASKDGLPLLSWC